MEMYGAHQRIQEVGKKSMNNWNNYNNNNNLQMGHAQFVPYNLNYQMPTYNPNRFPIYHADPIQGENAAWQIPMGPNSEIYLPDANEDLIWWIRTDANGNKNIMAFDVTPHEKKPPVDTNDLAARLAAVEEWINGKQNKSNAKRNANAATTASATVVE